MESLVEILRTDGLLDRFPRDFDVKSIGPPDVSR
jgi:hypothetical protein